MNDNGIDVIANHNVSLTSDILTVNDIAMKVAQALKNLALLRLDVDIVQAVNRHNDDDLLPSDGLPVTYEQRRVALDEQMGALREAFNPNILSKVDELLANQT